MSSNSCDCEGENEACTAFFQSRVARKVQIRKEDEGGYEWVKNECEVVGLQESCRAQEQASELYVRSRMQRWLREYSWREGLAYQTVLETRARIKAEKF